MKDSVFLLLAIFSFLFSCTAPTGDYVCKPCDQTCDELSFSEPGICPHCHMDLVKKEDLIAEKNLKINEIVLNRGSGAFIIEGGIGKIDNHIKVYYHKPANYHPDSKILFVIPGAGRNGDSYRDTWIEASEKHSILILSPQYPEESYDYGAYHMGNLIYDLNLDSSITYVENSNYVLMDEEKFSFRINSDRESWLFNDFERIFDRVVETQGSSQETYDVFGHSAGGQILHRFALFFPESRADRILAANAGSYTLPDFDLGLPFGIGQTPLSRETLKTSFKKNLVLYIGELDNAEETGGLLLRSPTVDKQGSNRLDRAKHFFNLSKKTAAKMGADFNWELVIIPNVGHDQKKMGRAASGFLYGME